MKTYEELTNSDELCKYCPIPEEARGVHCYGGVLHMCEGGHCEEAYENYLDESEEMNMCDCNEEQTSNEIKYYLQLILDTMNPEAQTVFAPQYIVTAVKLPTGAIEIAVNNQNIEDKIKYILEAYDDDMKLKTNHAIEMQNIMIV